MMPRKLQIERVEQYGSFLYCPKRETLCFGIYSSDGACKYETCLLDDPGYVKKQAEIEARIQENARWEREEKEREKREPPAPIRNQSKTVSALEQRIQYKEHLARKYYRQGKTRIGDKITQEIIILNRKLRKEKSK